MFCSQCGQRNAERNAFCTRCGKSLQTRVPLPSKVVLDEREASLEDEARNMALNEDDWLNHENEAQKKQSSDGREFSCDAEEQTPTRAQYIYMAKKITKGIFWLFVVIAVAYELLDPYHNVLGIKSMRQAYKYAMEVVQDEFYVAPSEIDFPKFDLAFIRRGDNITFEGVEYYTYYIDSYLYINVLGTKRRCDYSTRIGLPKDSRQTGYYYETPETSW